MTLQTTAGVFVYTDGVHTYQRNVILPEYSHRSLLDVLSATHRKDVQGALAASKRFLSYTLQRLDDQMCDPYHDLPDSLILLLTSQMVQEYSKEGFR